MEGGKPHEGNQARKYAVVRTRQRRWMTDREYSRSDLIPNRGGTVN